MVKVQLSVKRTPNEKLFSKYLKQARAMYNYPGMVPIFLETTTLNMQAKVCVSCEVTRGVSNGVLKNVVTRKLTLLVRKNQKHVETHCSFDLSQEKEFLRALKSVCCMEQCVKLSCNV